LLKIMIRVPGSHQWDVTGLKAIPEASPCLGAEATLDADWA
jgi:hypothetical protein